MADVSNLISLGLGSPASIKFLTTFGLGINTIVIVTPANRKFTPPDESRVFVPSAETRLFRPGIEDT